DRGWWLSLVRLTDEPIREYESANREVEVFRAGPSNLFSPFFRAVDDLEHCVAATHRAGLHARQLIAKGHARHALMPTHGQLDRLRWVRNHIEHTDDKLLNGQINQNEPFTIQPLEHRLEIGKVRVSYRDLASVITKCHHTIEAI